MGCRMDQQQKLVFKNYPVFLWIFAVIWSFGAFALLFIDLQPLYVQVGHTAAHVIVIVWALVAVAFLYYAFSHPAYEVWIVDPETKSITNQRRFLNKLQKQSYEFQAIKEIYLRTTKDSEGDPYYEIGITFLDGTNRIIKGSSFMDEAEKMIKQLREVTGKN